MSGVLTKIWIFFSVNKNHHNVEYSLLSNVVEEQGYSVNTWNFSADYHRHLVLNNIGVVDGKIDSVKNQLKKLILPRMRAKRQKQRLSSKMSENPWENHKDTGDKTERSLS